MESASEGREGGHSNSPCPSIIRGSYPHDILPFPQPTLRLQGGLCICAPHSVGSTQNLPLPASVPPPSPFTRVHGNEDTDGGAQAQPGRVPSNSKVLRPMARCIVRTCCAITDNTCR